MKFNCEEILISDEKFGCSITFYENKNGIIKSSPTVAELVKFSGQYLMLMRKYGEKGEEDYVYIETIDPLRSEELKTFLINLYRTKFSISYDKDVVEVNIDIDDKKFAMLKHIIEKITRKKGLIHFHD